MQDLFTGLRKHKEMVLDVVESSRSFCSKYFACGSLEECAKDDLFFYLSIDGLTFVGVIVRALKLHILTNRIVKYGTQVNYSALMEGVL